MRPHKAISTPLYRTTMRALLLLCLLVAACDCWGATDSLSWKPGRDASHSFCSGSELIVKSVAQDSGDMFFDSASVRQLYCYAYEGGGFAIDGMLNLPHIDDSLLIFGTRGYDTVPLAVFTSGDFMVNFVTDRDSIRLELHSHSTYTTGDFRLSIFAAGIRNVRVATLTGSMAGIRWQDSAQFSPWSVRYGTNPNNLDNFSHARNTSANLNGLDELTTYYYRIYRTDSITPTLSQCPLQRFTTPCDFNRKECINCTDLYSCRVQAYYGGFSYPTQYQGVINYGPASIASRHTVHNDTNEYDPRTRFNVTSGGVTRQVQLRTVPPGELASVRLGNWDNDAGSECLRYRYKVDTLINDLLILKYAVVLQAPRHGDANNPRFTFTIEDSLGNEIDHFCYAADFIPNSSATNPDAWYKHGEVWWLDWQIVGVDLTPLHNRTIFIRLTTRDCVYWRGHYGYAYFHLSCGNKRIKSLQCAETVENTFHAPEGFTYQWYRADEPETLLSTDDSLYVDRIGYYNCKMRFVGASSQSTCEFVSTAYAGPRYPVSRFDTTCTDTINCKFRFEMRNRSVISEDVAHRRLTLSPCESYHWVVDDTNHFYTAQLNYDFTFGDHTVTLHAMLANGLCSDSLTYHIHRDPVCRVYDTIYPSICDDSSIALFDTTFATAGVHRRDSGLFTHVAVLDVRPTQLVITRKTACDSFSWDSNTYTLSGTYFHRLRTTQDCDSTRRLNLVVNYATDTVVLDTAIENDLPHFAGGQPFSAPVNDTLIIIPNRHKCDSSIHYNLFVHYNKFSYHDSTICSHLLPFSWEHSLFELAEEHRLYYAGAASHGEDSTVVLRLTVNPDYYIFVNDTAHDFELPRHYRDRTYFYATDKDSFAFRTVDLCDSIYLYSLVVDFAKTHCDFELHFPNLVTPNGDGVNDTWRIGEYLENQCYDHCSLYIYSAFGSLVYSITNITDPEAFWDPQVNRTPPGTYFYRFMAHGVKGAIARQGVIEVLY